MIQSVLLAVLLAAPMPAAAAPTDDAAPVVELPRRPPPAKFWLKRYPLPTYGAHWRLELLVEDFGKAREKALKILKRYGAKPAIPVENSPSSEKHRYQQFSFRLPRRGAERVLKKLKRLGTTRVLRQTPDLHAETPEEVGLKLTRLKAERKAGGVILGRVTSIAAAADELIEHLEAVEAAGKAARERILFNIVIESPPQ
ncbi:MAG: hypothetical protein V3S11_02715 [Elusimicrobiota bacterium]